MAAVGSTSASADIAGSLTMEEIPIKLRCAACNKLAVNAFRLPCCEQSICENCQTSLPEACPVCAHEPVKAELCKPNKALRTTIKVFLRTEEKKRETQKAKDPPELPPPTLDTPVAVETPGVDGAHIVQVDTSGAVKDVSQDEPMNVGHADLEPSQNIGGPASVEVQMDIPRPSVEVTSLDQQFDQSKEPTAELAIETGMIETDRSHVNAESKHTGGDEQGLSVPGRQGHSGQWGPGQGPVQGQLFAGSFGFDGTGNGFPSMSGYSQGDFNQMMHFMPNGMANTGMGGFPNMMGMSGMGMDPMGMSQGMYGGLGGQGMGMNGMNGMNMGMGFGAGQSAYGGFSGQAATWNGGQDKFNPNAFGGHASGMGGDFGANAGYGGYNMPPHQGNYGQMHQPQYSNNNYQNGYNGQGYSQSGRGRGRGYSHTGRGRGGYGPAMQGNQGKQEKSYEPFHHQLPSQLLSQNPSDQQQPTSANESGGKPDETGTKAAESALINHELNPGDEDDNADAPTKNAAEAVTLPKGDVIVQPTEDSITAEIPVVVSTSEGTQQAENFRPAPIETMVIGDRAESDATPMQPIEEVAISPMTLMPPPTGPAAPLGPAALYKGDTSQDF
ncbi:MAG: hypothetical protein M1830_008877, partial [Pleopsidium flavum]